MKKNYKKRFSAIKIIFVALILFPTMAFAQKQMEDLGRGVLAVRTSSSKVLVS